MTGFAALERALDQAAGPVCFWWRDDDAGRPSPRLDVLLALAHELEVPLTIAAVPAWIEVDVAQQILNCPHAWVVQHGWAHLDHAREGERKIELGGAADLARMTARLSEGREKLRILFGAKFLDVLVPPWNRIAPALTANLGQLGYYGLSTWKGTDPGPVPVMVRRRDAEIDPIVWRGGPRFGGHGRIIEQVKEGLASKHRRPIGLMSHHLAFDDELFQVWRQLLLLLRDHRNSRLVAPEAVFRGAA